MNCEVTKEIFGIIRKVYNSIDEAKCDGDGFMRVRVTLDVTSPLCRGGVITIEDGQQFCAAFKYECLPNLCY